MFTSDACLAHIVVELVDFHGQFAFQDYSGLVCDFCLDHLMHLPSENKKAGRLFWRCFSCDRLCISIKKSQQIFSAGPLCCSIFSYVRVRFLPQSQIGLFSSTIWDFEIPLFGQQKTAQPRGFLDKYLFCRLLMSLPYKKDAFSSFNVQNPSIHAGLRHLKDRQAKL